MVTAWDGSKAIFARPRQRPPRSDQFSYGQCPIMASRLGVGLDVRAVGRGAKMALLPSHAVIICQWLSIKPLAWLSTAYTVLDFTTKKLFLFSFPFLTRKLSRGAPRPRPRLRPKDTSTGDGMGLPAVGPPIN